MKYLHPILWLGLCELGIASGDNDSMSNPRPKRQSSTPDSDKFIRRGDMAVAEANGYLYILGGYVSEYLDENKEQRHSAPVNRTLALPLRESWDVETVEIISTGPRQKYQQVTGHSVVAGRSNGRLRLWSWGGKTNKLNAALYILTPDGEGGGTYETESVPDSITRGEYGSATSCENSMIYFGGRARKQTDGSVRNLDDDSSIALPGVISYNFEDGTWSNKTGEGWPDSQQTYQRGHLVCVRVGEKSPIVVATGGGTIPATGARDDSSRMLDMSTIAFWDMEKGRWHKQSTGGGRAPTNRQSFCAVGAQGQNDTYEIFVYGGWDKDQKALDDIWILSLPGFRWFQTDAKSTPRFDHKCHRSGDQMLSIGGNVFPLSERVDELERGVGIFNLTSLEWQTNYVANREYESPAMVKEWYSKGGMDSVDWENDDVKAYFDRSSDSDGSSGSGNRSGDGTGDGDRVTDDESDGSDTPVGAIAGGVIGGVAAIAIACFLFWFIRRRRRNQYTAGLAEMPAGEHPDPSKDGQQGGYNMLPANRSELGPTGSLPPVEMDAGIQQNWRPGPSEMH